MNKKPIIEWTCPKVGRFDLIGKLAMANAKRVIRRLDEKYGVESVLKEGE